MSQGIPESDKPAGAEASGDPAYTAEPSLVPRWQMPAEGDRDSEINRELRRLNRALQALSASNKALARAGSERVLLQEICDIIVGVGAYRFSWIGYAQPDPDRLVRPMAYAGYEDGYLTNVDIRWSDSPAGRGPSGTAIRENRICVVVDVSTDPLFAPWREAALARGYAAAIALPLRVAGGTFGVLMIYSDQAGSFDRSEVELLSEMANNLAFGITALRSQEERLRATAALEEAEAKYRQLVEEVPAISYVAETGALEPFLYMSPQVETILGFKPEECLADRHFWWNHLHPDDRAQALQEDTWEEGRLFQVEYRMRRHDGRLVWVRDEAIIVRDPQTGKRLTRGVLIDITDLKRAEQALRESEERYRAFVTQSSEGIYRMEYDPPVPCHLPVEEQIAWGHKAGWMAECNDAMAKMYGRDSAAELIGKKLTEFLVLRDPVTLRFMEAFIRNGYRSNDQESIELDAHGQKRIFRNTMVGTIVNGHWVHTWGITRDVTERLQLEEQLRNAQQLEAIGRLAGGIAHDFNNILSIIMGHGELLLAMGAVDEQTRSGLEQMRRAADRAASLTQQLLAFSRKQVLQPRVLNLNETVASVQKMLTRVIGENIELVANLNSELMMVRADPGQLEQVVMNLLVNARDAMPQGGKIMMETANVKIRDEDRDLDLQPGRYVMLKVTDTGHGMDSATLSHVFEPFFTTKPVGKGTGLGLATVYGIVKQSGGSVRAESEAGLGTVFRVYLPAVEGKVYEQQAAADDVEGGVETILVAEDEPDLRELTRIFLQGYGYHVLEAASAELAIEKAEQTAEPIHLLLTDVIMPGMSGRQLAERIQYKRPQTKIVYMTGYTDDMVVQHKVLEPGVQLLQKPFTRVELGRKVRATLDGRG